MLKPINYAHRGASGYCPENTLAAFRKAIELGATGMETDVQMTKDGVLVLIHDESLQRTAGDPRLVKDVTHEQLQQLDAGSWYSGACTDERVPTLQSLLQLAAQHNITLNLELKNGLTPYPGLEQAVIAMVREYDWTGRTIISSFNHYSLAECKRLAPDIRTGVLYMEGLYEPWEYAKRLGANALHAAHYAVLPEWVAAAKEQGMIYNPFTVNDVKEMERLLDAGVAGIITDYPDRLAELLRTREGTAQ
ncbi:glycerophosphodiester phosphodiesterase [Paenibacillus sp. GCM10023252]|uniref:glycerophosphodiester phosphodiesterase n=1 Tax=Paenibacillus sp. GCM10023252 TaxID=3252649 RepID=UPI0036112047